MTEDLGDAPRDGETRRRRWYAVLTMFPFVFIPLLALISIACALIFPILRRLGYW